MPLWSPTTTTRAPRTPDLSPPARTTSTTTRATSATDRSTPQEDQSAFPRNRETRAPFVDELLPHKDAIDPKYTFLFSAPVADPDKNRAQVRFSRKTKEQYVMTEVDGKATGWKAFYRKGKWEVEQSGAGGGRKRSGTTPQTRDA